jgi:hypothetical protein
VKSADLQKKRGTPCPGQFVHRPIRTLPTLDSDFIDATRGYPTDFTDESNSLNQIPF